MFIYKIVNKTNGKMYIGQTQRPVEFRMYEHFKYHSYNSKLSRAILKYGAEAFTWETIDIASSIDELNKKETFWIKKLDTVKNGYNLKEGGRGNLVSEETREKLRRAATGKKMSDRLRRKMLEANSKPVYQYTLAGDLVGYFASAQEAANFLRTDNSSISAICRGNRRRMAAGFQWSYTPLLAMPPVRSRAPNKNPRKTRYYKPVAELSAAGDVLRTFAGPLEAARQYSCDPSAVVKACKGTRPSVHGHRFAYA